MNIVDILKRHYNCQIVSDEELDFVIKTIDNILGAGLNNLGAIGKYELFVSDLRRTRESLQDMYRWRQR